MRYIAVGREQLRTLLFDDGPLSEVVLATFIARREALQQREGVGFEVIGPRSSPSTQLAQTPALGVPGLTRRFPR